MFKKTAIITAIILGIFTSVTMAAPVNVFDESAEKFIQSYNDYAKNFNLSAFDENPAFIKLGVGDPQL